ncbi:MAG: hypothetical protein WA991_03875 [Ornithinimicrobium sp.]
MTTRQVAVYQGDELLCLGTIDEVAEHLGVLQKTIRYYTTPTYQRRLEAYRHPETSRCVVAIDEDE